MRATLIHYERVRNLGNYENERIGIDIQLEEGEKAEEALRLARLFVNRHMRGVESKNTDLEIISDEMEGVTENG